MEDTHTLQESYNQCSQLWQRRCDELFTDVKLICGNTGELAAHRLVLSAASPVFAELLQDTSRDSLGLPDFTTDQFLPFLEYLYKKTLTQFKTTQDFIHGIYAAHKYNLPQLKEKLKPQLQDQLSQITGEILSAAVTCLEMCKRFAEEEEEVFVPMANQVVIMQLDNLLQAGLLTFDILDQVLSAQNLKYRPEEEELFRISDQWATAFCVTKDQDPSGANKRSALGTLINKIHFLDIPEKIIATEISKSGLLNGDEISQIMVKRYDDSAAIFFVDGTRSGEVFTKIQIQSLMKGSRGFGDPKNDKLKAALDQFMDKEKVVGDTWYMIPAEWLGKWEKWYNDKDNRVQKPGSVATYSLLCQGGYYDGDLQSENKIPHSYISVPEEVWELISAVHVDQSRYGFYQRINPLPRKVVSVGTEEAVLETALRHINHYGAPCATRTSPLILQTSKMSMKFSRTTSLHEIVAKLKQEYAITSYKNVRVWISEHTTVISRDNRYTYVTPRLVCIVNSNCGLYERIDCERCGCDRNHYFTETLSILESDPLTATWIALEVQNYDGTWKFNENSAIEPAKSIHIQ